MSEEQASKVAEIKERYSKPVFLGQKGGRRNGRTVEFKIKLIQAERDIDYLLDEIDRLQEELEEQLEAKGHIGKQAQAYCKMADENRAKFLSAQQEIEYLKKQNSWKSEKAGEWARQCEDFKKREQKLIEVLQWYTNHTVAHVLDKGKRAKTILKELGVTE